MSAVQNLLKTTHTFLKRSPVYSSLPMSVLSLGLEKLAELNLSCPCNGWNEGLITLMFIGPALFLWALMFVWLAPFRSCSKDFYVCSKRLKVLCCALENGKNRHIRFKAFAHSLIPSTMWVIFLFLDGDYLACSKTTWIGHYVFDQKLNRKWCQPSDLAYAGNESDLHQKYQKIVGISQVVGYTMLGLLGLLIICFWGCYVKIPKTDVQTEQGEDCMEASGQVEDGMETIGQVEDRMRTTRQGENDRETAVQVENNRETAGHIDNVMEIIGEVEDGMETIGQVEDGMETIGQVEDRMRTTRQGENDRETAVQVENDRKTAGQLEDDMEIIGEVEDGMETIGQVEDCMETIRLLKDDMEIIGEVEDGMETTGQVGYCMETIRLLKNGMETIGLVEDGMETIRLLKNGMETIGQVDDGMEIFGLVKDGLETIGQVEDEMEAAGDVEDGMENAGQVKHDRDTAGQVNNDRDSAGQVETLIVDKGKVETFRPIEVERLTKNPQGRRGDLQTRVHSSAKDPQGKVEEDIEEESKHLLREEGSS
ncbi:uncharacterized protein LOC130430203 [Triplophysa dalaica]|uniref:uncharacterized protein LOC130430203 n=1 Tax=Triplophysa dalaica TaxID=1582913 RepID=UPI0024DF80C7|nr:uncharacterized protein LOC130430203 [Triplophysa dalaica]XP_056615202.1 uncharacterized protein LOC130430203 [Triplophysa dalaica]